MTPDADTMLSTSFNPLGTVPSAETFAGADDNRKHQQVELVDQVVS